MCLTILEVVFLVAGVWLLITGKVPARLFQPLFGKGNYVMEPMQARLFGALLASPLPVVVGLSVLLMLVLGEDATGWLTAFEVFYVVVIAVCAIVIARRTRQPIVPKQEAETS